MQGGKAPDPIRECNFFQSGFFEERSQKGGNAEAGRKIYPVMETVDEWLCS